MPTMRELQASLADVGKGACPDAAALKATTQAFNDKKWLIQQVLSLVSSAVSGFKKAKQTAERDKESRLKKETARAQKLAKTAAKAAAKRAPQRTSPSGWAVWRLTLQGHKQIAEQRPHAPCLAMGAETSEQAKEIFESKAVKLNFLVFRTGFAKSSGPAEQRTFKDGAGQIMESMGPSHDMLVKFPEGDMQAVVEECSLWGLRLGEERFSVAQNGLGALICVGSERASMQAVLVPHGFAVQSPNL